MHIFIVFSCLTLASAKIENVIDVDDILSAEYMPGSLLVLENPEENVRNFTNGTFKGLYLNETFHEGTFDVAFSTMGFHRTKMNEYLCRNFIAEQIIENMSITRMRRRSSSNEDKAPSNHKLSLRDNLIEDEGSSNYKSWLSKSTTLEDIYRHYQDVEKREDEVVVEEDEEDGRKEEPVEAESYDQQVTGYAYSQPQVPVGPAKMGHSGGGVGYDTGAPWHSTGGHGPITYTYTAHTGHGHTGHGGGSGGGGGHPSYGYSGPAISHHGVDEYSHIHIHPEPVPPKYHGTKDDHGGGKDLSELFEVALTALAYLSFGMFVVHVVMCISQAKKQEHPIYVPVISVMTSSTPGTVGTGMSGGGIGGTGMGMGGVG